MSTDYFAEGRERAYALGNRGPIEFDETGTIFSNPGDERTEAYVTGRFG